MDLVVDRWIDRKSKENDGFFQPMR